MLLKTSGLLKSLGPGWRDHSMGTGNSWMAPAKGMHAFTTPIVPCSSVRNPNPLSLRPVCRHSEKFATERLKWKIILWELVAWLHKKAVDLRI